MTFAISKKRTRHLDMDSMDELPISKKLNLLSIGSSAELAAPCACSSGRHGYGQSNMNCKSCCNTHHMAQVHCTNTHPHFNQCIIHQEYNPSLSERENPEYFHINRVLFEAHKTRIAGKDVIKWISSRAITFITSWNKLHSPKFQLNHNPCTINSFFICFSQS